MTPLARRITNELTLPLKRRSFIDRGGILKCMDDIHCFELTEVFPLLDDLSQKLAVETLDGNVAAIDKRLLFLPAPKTWIEFRDIKGDRVGFLLQERDGVAFIDAAISRPFTSAPRSRVGAIFLGESANLTSVAINLDESWSDSVQTTCIIYAALALINSPRIIGRRQHMPHRGLERDLTRKFKLTGKFPLHAWTEIKLEVNAPWDMRGEPSTEAHLTGQRALHFCRAHLRVRLGKLEIVKAHWRGDASLGIKQSRYHLERHRATAAAGAN